MTALDSPGMRHARDMLALAPEHEAQAGRDTPSLSPATRLALRGEEITRNARDTATRSELEISGAFRRR